MVIFPGKGSNPEAKFPVLARLLVAKTGGFPEAVEIAFLELSFAVNGSQADLETLRAQPVGVIFLPVFPFAPGLLTPDALVFHYQLPAGPAPAASRTAFRQNTGGCPRWRSRYNLPDINIGSASRK
jgi:hypothetical protein